MGGRKCWGPPQYIALAAVIAVHLVFLVSLVVASRSRQSPVKQFSEITALIFVPPARASRRSPVAAKQTRHPNAITPPLILRLPLTELEPGKLAPDIDRAPADWTATAQGAANRIAAPRTGTSFGFIPSQPDNVAQSPKSWWSTPVHHSGEQHRLDSGEWIVWISDSCFIVINTLSSEPPDEVMRGLREVIGFPDAHCPSKSGIARGDLFDSLPE